MKIKHFALLVFGAASFCASCSGKSDDNIFLDKVNEALAKVHVANKVTCQDAINSVVAVNPELDPTAYQFSDKNRCFAYDIDVQQFIIMSGDSVLFAPQDYVMNYSLSVFKFTDIYTANTKFSQYLTDVYPGSDTLIITTGVDTGNHTDVQKIYYENNGEPQRIFVRTGCDYLNINAPKDEIHHFNLTNNIFVTAVQSYHEYGTSAYMKASYGEIVFEPKSEVDMFEIPGDCRLFVSTKTHKDATVYATIGADEVPSTKLTLCEVHEPSDFNNDANFFRLVNNVTFADNQYWNVERSVCLDLNGHRLKFHNAKGDTIEKDIHPAILVNANDSDEDINCYILDSQNQLFESSGIYTTDCAIVAWGGPNAAANLVMNGGKVTATRDTNGDPAIVSIGEYNNPTSKGYSSNLVMYGGKVTIKNVEGSTRIGGGLKCLQPKGAGATIKMVYGNLESEGFCISGMGSQDNYGGTSVDITGGTFIGGTGNTKFGDETYPCLFFPQSGTVNIYGGNFIGPSCVTGKSGTINIYGGTYTATRDFVATDATNDGILADGCVIHIESNNSIYAGGIKVNVSGNPKMVSRSGYITRIVGYDGHTPEVSVTHNDGVYQYAKDKFDTFDDSIGKVVINGGTWVKA